MKNFKFIIPLIALALFSCSDYLDVNNDPNRLLLTQIGPDKLLPTAMVSAYRNQAINENQLGTLYTNGWASNVSSFTNGFTQEFQLVIDNAFYRQIFENCFLSVNNFQLIIDTPNGDHKNDNYIAASKICKAHYLQYMVDLYGDIPYTGAFKGLANASPKYNDDQFVYRQLLKELDDARALIIAANPSATDISSYDVMLNGDMAKWIDFANTIELRMLLRMSNNTGAVAAYRDARLASLQKSFITTDVTINPGYNKSTDAQMNPFLNNFFVIAAGTAQQNYTAIAMSGHAFKCMRSSTFYNNTPVDAVVAPGVNYPGVTDIRSQLLFRGTMRAVTQGANFVGIPSATNVDITGPGLGTPSRLGYGLANPYFFNPTPLAAVADITDFYSNAPGFVMTASESDFLQAEAELRGYSGFTAAAAPGHFDAGIDASYDRLGITAQNPALAGPYKAAINTKLNYGWVAAGTFNQKLHAIMYQKWVALLGLHGIESFIEYNRTGFPVTPLAVNATQVRKPRRLIYPTSEYIANSSNVPNITSATVFAATDPSHPFWQLGNPALGN